MRRLFFLGCTLAFAGVHAEAAEQIVSEQVNIKVASCCEAVKPQCSPACPRGPKGPRGSKGERGERGRKGPVSAPFAIVDVIEVTTRTDALIDPGTLIAFDPIINSVNGLTVALPGGLALVESVSGSGNFDTITLPAEPRDTLYSVSYGASINSNNVELQATGDFQLVLNGTALVYTTLGLNPGYIFVFDDPNDSVMVSQTSVIRNPANTAGTLSLMSLDVNTPLSPVTDLGFSAYMTVIKLNQNH